MLKQANVYRNTYTNVSVRTGINRQTYYDNQWNLNNRLSSLGLRDNVRSSEVQTMWNSLANTGMNESQMFATAIDNVVTNKIVPYLDTTSQEFNLLNTRLNNDFVKDIRGINKANLEIAGNNYVTESLLNTIIDKVQPMSDEALQNLALGSTEITSFVNTLMSKGYDRDTAVSYATKYFQAQEYGDQMLSSGSTADKLFMADIMTNPNLNLYDLDDATNIMALYGNRALEFAGNLGGYSSSINGVVTNMVAHGLGYTYGDFSNAYKLLDEGLTFTDIANNTSLTPAQLSAYSNQATNTFASGQNQTVEELQSVTLENFMNELAVIYEKLGLTGPIIVGAIEGIGNIIKTVIGVKLAGSLLGGGSGLLGKAGSAIGTGLSNAGSTLSGVGITGGAATALGAAGVTAGITGAAYGISTGIGQLQEGETGLGVTNIAGGAAMGVGAGMLLASNPVGWVVGAIGGAALLGARLYESANAYKEAGKVVEKEFNNVADSLQEEYDTREDNLYRIKENLQDSDTLEQARSELISSGLLTEEEINEARTANKESLEALTDKYLEETGRLSDEANDLLDKYSDIDAQNATNVMGSIKDWYDEYKNVENETNFDTMYDMVKAVMESENFSNLSESDQEFAKKQWNVIQTKKTEGTLDQADLEWFLDRGDNGHLFYSTVSGQALEDFTRRAQNRGAGVNKYNDIDANLVSQYLLPVVQAETKEEAETALKNAKAAGLSRSTYSEIQETMDKFGIESYRQGINDVPEDQLAILHQGEAVLTASTANELRNMTDVYRETTSQTFNLDAIIQNQTSALIIKMDEIIRAITTGVSGTQSLTRNTADAKVWDSMIHMESTKAF